jgi:hypothetical protein
MQLLTVLAWIAAIYCAGGLLTALAVSLLAGDHASAEATSSSGAILKTFLAWPVVVAHTAMIAIFKMTQKVRPRP